jgi:hypothetical protein
MIPKNIHNQKVETDGYGFDAIIAAEEDFEQSKHVEPSHTSVKSFWFGFTGIAILTHLAAFFVMHVLAADWLSRKIAILVIDQPSTRAFWETIGCLQLSIGIILIPSLIASVAVPIIYWRGGLMLRFTLSIVLAIAIMNMTSDAWDYRPRLNLNLWMGVVASWVALPTLFLFAPIRPKPIKLAVLGCILVLIVCMSMLTMTHAPSNSRFLYWEILYGGVLLVGVLQRNWGSRAILEADTTADQIERTSTLTLMELMIVCWVACAISLYWATRIDMGKIVYLASAFAFGIGCLFGSLGVSYVLQRITTSRIARLFMMLGIWFVMTAVFSVASFIWLSNEDFLRAGLDWFSAISVTPSVLLVCILVGSAVSGFFFTAFNIAIYTWLRFCGWRWVQKISS